jgi:hypothetical protein
MPSATLANIPLAQTDRGVFAFNLVTLLPGALRPTHSGKSGPAAFWFAIAASLLKLNHRPSANCVVFITTQ